MVSVSELNNSIQQGAPRGAWSRVGMGFLRESVGWLLPLRPTAVPELIAPTGGEARGLVLRGRVVLESVLTVVGVPVLDRVSVSDHFLDLPGRCGGRCRRCVEGGAGEDELGIAERLEGGAQCRRRR